ncbi:MAG: Chemotaxis protein CheY [Alphaproteobacteria bacterium ADurb.Bin438]|nr:MAG: Chemotaxis protein CheY [Alphaproteobacteria bacterium ADurb.Bin438]
MANYSLERLNFLVVDDNKHMRALVKTILHAFGSKNVHDASDGADAFKELRVFPADIIITDWNMDPLDGIDFTKLVRTGKDSPNPFVPIIMLTGHTEMHRIIEARDSGVNEFLAKPISAKSLYSRIKSIIEKPRPFIRTKTYFGPDRRRRNIDYKGIERRKTMLEQVQIPVKPSASAKNPNVSLSEDEVNALLNK